MDRPGPHYSVDMLRLMGKEFPGMDLIFLIGADSLRDLPTWSRPGELIQLAALGVMPRPGITPDMDALSQKFPVYASACCGSTHRRSKSRRQGWLPASPPDSRSAIRSRMPSAHISRNRGFMDKNHTLKLALLLSLIAVIGIVFGGTAAAAIRDHRDAHAGGYRRAN